MKEAVITDTDGFYTSVTIVEDHASGVTPLYADELLIGYQVAESVQEGFHLPRWDLEGSYWKEGKTNQEIEDIQSQVIPISHEQEIKNLKVKLAKQELVMLDFIAYYFQV